MNKTDYPTFEEAVEQLRGLAIRQGAPETLLFLEPSDIVLRGQRAYVHPQSAQRAWLKAERSYKRASERQFGVLLLGLCQLRGALCVCTASPADSEDASSRLYPNGLKLSIREPLLEALHTAGLRWWLLKLQEQLWPTPWKEEFLS
jgi:hypothetical protein